MSRPEIVPASPAHIRRIANRMREADAIECAAIGLSPKQALRHSLRTSGEVWTAKVDGRPEAMFGLQVVSALGGKAHPWMLGTEAIYDYPREMIRMGRQIIDHWRDSTPDLSVLVAVQNVRAIRFLRGCGFATDPDILPIGGVSFVRMSCDDDRACLSAEPAGLR